MDEHTLRTIIYQCINVGILLGGLIYFLRKPTKEFFQKRQSDFMATARRADEARQAAERERSEIQVRLSKLESTTDESISRARAEAADMKKALIAEAHAVSKRIQEEAESAAKLEATKAKHQLREQMIRDAAEIASRQIEEKISVDDQKRLQGDFIEHIQVVHQ